MKEELKKVLNISVFHDDQHGTAVVCSAGIMNALKTVKKEFTGAKVVIDGEDAVRLAIAQFLLAARINPAGIAGNVSDAY